MLRTLTDEGVLLPHWGRWRLDATGLTQMRLPSEAASLLRRRIQAIDPIARTVLTAASVIGMSFEVALLETVAPATAFQVSAALTESRRSQLIEGAGDGLFRFVHHTVRETLLAECDGPVLEGLHQAVAEALDAEGTTGDSSEALTFEVEGEASVATIGLSGALGTGHDSPDADKIYRVAYHYAGRNPDPRSRRDERRRAFLPGKRHLRVSTTRGPRSSSSRPNARSRPYPGRWNRRLECRSAMRSCGRARSKTP